MNTVEAVDMSPPTIGRIVHYRLIDSGKIVPGIIVDVLEGGKVDLFVMTSGRFGTEFEEGTFFERSVIQGKDKGKWSWPRIIVKP